MLKQACTARELLTDEELDFLRELYAVAQDNHGLLYRLSGRFRALFGQGCARGVKGDSACAAELRPES